MKIRSYTGTKIAAPLFLAIAFFLLACTPASTAGDARDRLILLPILDDLDAPIYMAHHETERLYVVEREGRIHIIENGQVLEAPFLDISNHVGTYRECGLLSMAFAPDYAESGDFYVYYSYDVEELGDLIEPVLEDEPNDGCDSVVSRFQVNDDDNTVDPTTEERLLLVNQPYNNHNAGQINFGSDGYLYIALGDGGSGGDPHGLAQNGASLLGKILRIDVSADGPYTIPADNPFVGDAAFRDEIWAMGLRNPWRFSFDRQTGDLFIGDVGQGLYEEINFQAAASGGGENYGWNLLEGTHCYDVEPPCLVEGMTPPILEYDRSSGSSVTGGYRYRGSAYAALTGVYVYADYGSANIFGATESSEGWQNEIILRNSDASRIVSLAEDVNGELYVIDLSGTIFRIVDRASYSEQQYLPLLAQE